VLCAVLKAPSAAQIAHISLNASPQLGFSRDSNAQSSGYLSEQNDAELVVFHTPLSSFD
jgi:hypothetical protein